VTTLLRVRSPGGQEKVAGVRAGLFLDRDGTLIEHRTGHVRALQQIAFLPGVLDALSDLRSLDLVIVVTSNQSAVSRGLLDAEDAVALHEYVLDEIEAAGGRVDASYLCPHQPSDDCWCRKPRPGMYEAAARDLGCQLSSSTIVGDAVCDMLAAIAIGARPVLVRTGLGQASADELAAKGLLDRCQVYASLREVAADLVAAGSTRRP
jgi:D-glycero-D-manno-heptose 1,7-bisphosphate phosphatase